MNEVLSASTSKELAPVTNGGSDDDDDAGGDDDDDGQ